MKYFQTALASLLLFLPLRQALCKGPLDTGSTPQETIARAFPGNPSSFASVSEAFQAVMLRSGTPGGAAVVEGCGTETQNVVRVYGATVGEALNSIETGSPLYRWELKDGVVDLLPTKGAPQLLESRIREFDSRDSTDISSAGSLLFALPDVRNALERLGLRRNASGSGLYAVTPGIQTRRARLSLRLHDVSVRDALNAIVRANKAGVWIYRETRCATEQIFDINFSQ